MSKECSGHGKPGHVCNHTLNSVSENLDEIEFSRSIHAACISNNATRVQSLLSKSSNRGVSPANSIDSAGYSPLHYASRTGNLEICTMLLNAGADVDAKTPEQGMTPLMRAVQQNRLDVARLLVSYGASIEDKNTDQENLFHILAAAASNASNDSKNSEGVEKFRETAAWLRVKANSKPGRLESMLNAQDIRGLAPVDRLLDLGDNNILSDVFKKV